MWHEIVRLQWQTRKKGKRQREQDVRIFSLPDVRMPGRREPTNP